MESTKAKERYWERVEKGICVKCGSVSEERVCCECKEVNKEYLRKSHLILKLETFARYGGAKCSCCGETRLEFLTLDHIENNGNVSRKKEGLTGGSSYYSRLRKKGYPPGYQVLCFNCNASKSFFGGCPHKQELVGIPDVELPVKLFYPDAKLPFQKYVDDAGLDLFAYREYIIPAHETIKLDCGVAIDIPIGYFGLITPRSSWRQKGLLCQSIFDAGFQGLIEPFTTNLSNSEVSIPKGERILQMVLIPVPISKTCTIIEDFQPSMRGSLGAGSTGKK